MKLVVKILIIAGLMNLYVFGDVGLGSCLMGLAGGYVGYKSTRMVYKAGDQGLRTLLAVKEEKNNLQNFDKSDYVKSGAVTLGAMVGTYYFGNYLLKQADYKANQSFIANAAAYGMSWGASFATPGKLSILCYSLWNIGCYSYEKF